MSILIKNMEIPKECGKCFIGDRTICKNGCPLVEVPEQKHGQWIKADDGFDESWVCSECMEEYVSVDADFIDYAHYCPNCGARMVTDDV